MSSNGQTEPGAGSDDRRRRLLIIGLIVLALLILIASPVVIARTSTDIFPSINIPVIAVAWNYRGLNTEELEGRITSNFERTLTTTVDNIQRIESTTTSGQSIIKVYLQPGARLDTANAQITAISQTVLRQFPPGTLPPLIINYSASSVPILQLALSGEGLAEQQLFDLAVLVTGTPVRVIERPGTPAAASGAAAA